MHSSWFFRHTLQYVIWLPFSKHQTASFLFNSQKMQSFGGIRYWQELINIYVLLIPQSPLLSVWFCQRNYVMENNTDVQPHATHRFPQAWLVHFWKEQMKSHMKKVTKGTQVCKQLKMNSFSSGQQHCITNNHLHLKKHGISFMTFSRDQVPYQRSFILCKNLISDQQYSWPSLLGESQHLISAAELRESKHIISDHMYSESQTQVEAIPIYS